MTDRVTRVVLAHRGEFGSKVCWHAPAFHALQGEKIVYVELGEEALYPGAEQYVVVPKKIDAERRWFPGRDDEFVKKLGDVARKVFKGPEYGVIELSERSPRALFRPAPHIPQELPPIDVVICPRWRKYGSGKNWEHWLVVSEELRAAGLNVFAAGAIDSSYEIHGIPRAWDWERSLDATIGAMRMAKLVIATDNGLAHLAVACGAPLVVITHTDGIVAPGPQLDERGKAMQAAYGPVNWARYQQANHMKSRITAVEDGWENPNLVLQAASQLLVESSASSKAEASATPPHG